MPSLFSTIIFPLLGGLGLFLYGMEVMSKGIQRTAGNKLKSLLRTFTSNRFLGMLSGIITTSVAQSSAVTTVMVVSFVNTGLLALPQAISVILGAHIGTTITAQIIAFKIDEFSLPIIAIGVGLHLLGRTERMRSIGEAIFGLGILFFGLNLIGHSLDPLRDNAAFRSIFQTFSIHPVLGLLVGMAVTTVVNSSTITTGITIALALSSLISFEQAVPLILGENIGSTVTANLAAINGSHVAKQAARAHFIVNAVGAFIALVLLKPFMNFVLWISPIADVARQIANAHTFFNIFTTIVFLPFIGFIAYLSNILIFGKRKDEELFYLDEPSLEDSDTALDQVLTALGELHTFADQSLHLAQKAIIKGDESKISQITHFGEKIERYQSRITEYLEKVSSRRLSAIQSRRIPKLVRILHEIERVRDYEEKLKQTAIHLISEGRSFTRTEAHEITELFKAAHAVLMTTAKITSTGEKKYGEQVLEEYESINELKDELRVKSQLRLGKDHAEIAVINYYYDVISSIEEIARKCRNIAYSMIN